MVVLMSVLMSDNAYLIYPNRAGVEVDSRATRMPFWAANGAGLHEASTELTC